MAQDRPIPPAPQPSLAGAELSTVRESGDARTVVAIVAGPTGPAGLEPNVCKFELLGVDQLSGFVNRHGFEFEPIQLPVDEPAELTVTAGRSTQGAVPWLAAEVSDGAVIITLHWSGNWRLRTTPTTGGVRVEVSLPEEGQRIVVQRDERLELPAVSFACGRDVAEAAAALSRHLARQAPTGRPLLTEWNHWFPYTDAKINEDVFLTNAELAADLGLELALLDAGWFGPADKNSKWGHYRGDWQTVNTERFPHGLAWLADQTRRRGLEFGIWIEPEAIGARAAIAEQRPDIVARAADGTSLGYVCLGSPAARDHIRSTVSDLIDTTKARWIKWDFNLDPGTGCASDDHGHRSVDGLLRHYHGLYSVLAELRALHPDVVLEACASGGLRIDAGLSALVDAFYLSDGTWTDHHLACLWGATRMLPPRQLLQFPHSEMGGMHPFPKVDYSGTLITVDEFDTKIRAAMLHRFGISVRLNEMRADLRERLRGHIEDYKTRLRPLIETGTVVGLTPQPLREKMGHQLPAFQLIGEGPHDGEHVVAGYRLLQRLDWEPIRPLGLEPGIDYLVQAIGADGDEHVRRGSDLLTDGLLPSTTKVSSVMWSLRPAR